jgi:hypothetical protein
MSKKLAAMLGLVVLISGLLYGCGGSAGTPQANVGSAASTALKVTGSVDEEIGWTEEEVRAMTTIEAQSTNKEGETETHTGVLITTLLEAAGVKSGATAVAFVADDGFTAEVTLAEVQECADCIVAFRDSGGFSTVLPGFPGKVQVKGVIEIQVNP